MSVLRSGWRLPVAARIVLGRWRAAPALPVAVRYGGGGPAPESKFLEPNGFLFNEKPLLPGEKRQKEDWENVFVYGMSFNFLLVLIIAFFKPDTSVSAWAHEQAVLRLREKEETAVADEPMTD